MTAPRKSNKPSSKEGPLTARQATKLIKAVHSCTPMCTMEQMQEIEGVADSEGFGIGRRLGLIASTKDGAFFARLSNDAPLEEAQALAVASHHISDYLRRQRELLDWVDRAHWRLLLALAVRDDNEELGLLGGDDGDSPMAASQVAKS